MSPRQMLRARDVRAPQHPSRLGEQTDRQVRQYPDAAGVSPLDNSLDEHFNVLHSRVRLNAGALDWRQGPSPGTGNGDGSDRRLEELHGDKDGVNTIFTSSQHFIPQSMRFVVNGLLQAFASDGSRDFTIQESQGSGTGYDTVVLAWAPLAQDYLIADFIPAPVGD